MHSTAPADWVITCWQQNKEVQAPVTQLLSLSNLFHLRKVLSILILTQIWFKQCHYSCSKIMASALDKTEFHPPLKKNESHSLGWILICAFTIVHYCQVSVLAQFPGYHFYKPIMFSHILFPALCCYNPFVIAITKSTLPNLSQIIDFSLNVIDPDGMFCAAIRRDSVSLLMFPFLIHNLWDFANLSLLLLLLLLAL